MGIRKATIQRRISGCRVAFDPRTTAEAHVDRDERNYKAEEQAMRKADWIERTRERQAAE